MKNIMNIKTFLSCWAILSPNYCHHCTHGVRVLCQSRPLNLRGLLWMILRITLWISHKGFPDLEPDIDDLLPSYCGV